MSQDNKQVSQKGLKVSVKVTLSKDEVAKGYTKHLVKVSGQMNLKGFRRGAHALKVKEIDRTKGPLIRAEVIDQMLQKALTDVI